MKRIVETDTRTELDKFLGKQVVFMCLNYFVTGILVGINDDFFVLEDPHIIYETGPWSDGKWKDCQDMKEESINVMKSAVEMWFETYKKP